VHARILTVVDGSSSGLCSAKSTSMCSSQAESLLTLLKAAQELRSVPLHSTGQASSDVSGVRLWFAPLYVACVTVMSVNVKVEANEATSAADIAARIFEELSGLKTELGTKKEETVQEPDQSYDMEKSDAARRWREIKPL
jgi:hypothetical protein